MQEVDSEIFIIVSGVPIVNNILISGDRVSEFTRTFLFDLINKKGKFFLILSGEVHFGMISQHGFKKEANREDDLYEITASGLSHHIDKIYQPDNLIADQYNNSTDYRYYGYNYGFIDIRKSMMSCSVHVNIKADNGEDK